MGYIITKHHLIYPNGVVIPIGTILEANSNRLGWVVTSGFYKKHVIPIESCESLPLYQELLQRREEIVELMKEKEELHGENLRLSNRIKQIENNVHKMIANLVKSVYAD